jgi:hypothetical protein
VRQQADGVGRLHPATFPVETDAAPGAFGDSDVPQVSPL